ncbi:MAG: ribonuclease HII [bacterium]|nr:ribonuclease HII [bacterium]
MHFPNKFLEKKLFRQGYKFIYAVDEVGVGPLAGPVTACAVLITPEFLSHQNRKFHGIRDSKLLSPKQREKFAEELKKDKNIKFAVAYAHVKTIDKLNIYQAARKAMAKAIAKLKAQSEKRKTTIQNSKQNKMIVLVDGRATIDGLDIEQMPIVKGDRKVFSIACASIIAKVARDKVMNKYAKKYPQYGFEKHKGYGTKLHLARLASHGPCEIHRKSFEPVAKLVTSN